MDQNRTPVSADAVASFPNDCGAHDTDTTGSVWPDRFNFGVFCRAATFHTRADPFAPPASRYRPSGLNTADPVKQAHNAQPVSESWGGDGVGWTLNNTPRKDVDALQPFNSSDGWLSLPIVLNNAMRPRV